MAYSCPLTGSQSAIFLLSSDFLVCNFFGAASILPSSLSENVAFLICECLNSGK